MSRTKHSFWFKLSTSMATCSHQPPSESGHDDDAGSWQARQRHLVSDAYLESEPRLLVAPVRRSNAPDASQSEICKQLARVVLDFAKPVFLTQPANRGIGIIVYKDPRNSRVDVPEYDLMVTESRMVWKLTVVTPRRGRESRTMSRRSSSIRRWRVPGAGQRG